MDIIDHSHLHSQLLAMQSEFYHNAAPVFMREEQSKLRYDQIARINDRLADSKRYHLPLTVRYWKRIADDHGAVLAVQGVVGAFDPLRHEVRINQRNGRWAWIHVGRIVAVE